MSVIISQKRRIIDGFTLIELLVGLAVGLIVLTGVVQAWTISVRTNAQLMSSARVNNEIRTLVHLITQDMRRAYWPAANPTDIYRYPIISYGVRSSIEIGNTSPTTEADCVNFWVNYRETLADGSDIIVPVGYRLMNGIVEMWWVPPASSSAGDEEIYDDEDVPFGKCDEDSAADGDPSGWFPLMANDAQFQVTSLNFSLDGSRCLFVPVSARPEDEDGNPLVSEQGACPVDTMKEFDDEEEYALHQNVSPPDFVELTQVKFVFTGLITAPGGNKDFSLSESMKVRNDMPFWYEP